MTENDKLFALLKSELWQIPMPKEVEINSDTYQNLSEIAQVQAVDGLFLNSLMFNGITLDRYNAAKTFALSARISMENDMLNKEIIALTQLLSAHQIKFFFVKGQTIAALYPHPESRISGDIDFYVYPDDFEKAWKIIQDHWQVEMEEDKEGEQHLNFLHNDIVFEMHYNLMHFSSKHIQRVFDNFIKDASIEYRLIDNVQVPVIEEDLNLVYSFLHLYHHLIEVGVGLRQFCDILVLIKHLSPTPGRKKRIRTILRQLGYLKSFYVIESILFRYLGLPSELLLSPDPAAYQRYQNYILQIVFRGGNFGKYGRKNEVRSGWRYNMEMLGVKLTNHYKLFILSPRENTAFLLKTLPKKILYFI
ncbi:MAG: nucleotidyltransferase family protein [Prevotella sp.]|nr:nucleotidyltransferase family protein [Prevotella sp.]